jgi:hypothetical protein
MANLVSIPLLSDQVSSPLCLSEAIRNAKRVVMILLAFVMLLFILLSSSRGY